MFNWLSGSEILKFYKYDGLLVSNFDFSILKINGFINYNILRFKILMQEYYCPMKEYY
jgi:hypothetical protein